jgi:hypothetical protein
MTDRDSAPRLSVRNLGVVFGQVGEAVRDAFDPRKTFR